MRSATDPAFAYYGIRHGGTSKDVWIPTEDAEKAAPTPIVPEHRHATVRRLWIYLVRDSMICFGLAEPAKVLIIYREFYEQLSWSNEPACSASVIKACHF